MSSPYDEKIWTKAYDNWVDPNPEVPALTFTDLLEESFREFSESPAYHFMGVTATFRELNDQSARFANYLADCGLGPGDVVAMALPNIPQYMVALAGAFRAGCTVTGISVLLTAEEMAYQLNDSGAKCFVCLDATYEQKVTEIAGEIPSVSHIIVTNVADHLAAYKRILGKIMGRIPSGKVSDLDGKSTILYKEVFRVRPPHVPEVSFTPQQTMLLQYTGGTTGSPKGAILTHEAIVSNVMNAETWFNQGKGVDTICSAFPIFHIAGGGMCFLGMATGNAQILIPDPRNTEYICEMYRQHQPTIVANVPSLYRMLMDTPAWHELDFSDVKGFFSGAAPFAPKAIRELEEVVGEGKVIEAYGMTETSGAITANPFAGPKKIGSVGLPFPNVKARIVDLENGTREVEPGDEGELIFSSRQVTTGYHSRPEETQEALREFEGDIYMYTGDVARMDEDGYFYIVDRTKDMIVVSGFKVFSSEVEAHLAKHPAVGHCAFIGEEDPERPGSELVKAVIEVASSHKDKDKDELRDDIIVFCKKHMAPYKVPKVVEFVDEMPLTNVGKIDKKALRKMEAEQEAAAAEQ